MEQGFTEFYLVFTQGGGGIACTASSAISRCSTNGRHFGVPEPPRPRQIFTEFFIEFHFNPFFLPFKFLFTEFID